MRAAALHDPVGIIFQAGKQALAEQYDFSDHAHVLDIGGGTGSFLIPLLTHYARLRATLVDRAEVTAVARERLTGAGLSERVSLQAGDFFSCQMPTDADVILLANVVHIFSPQHNGELLGRLRASAARGTRLLLVDFWTDDSHAEPTFAAIMAGEFLLASGEGAVYSFSEIRGWLETAGWHMRDHLALAGPASVVVGDAV